MHTFFISYLLHVWSYWLNLSHRVALDLKREWERETGRKRKNKAEWNDKGDESGGDCDRIWGGARERDRDWARHQMEHERGGGEAGNQYILIISHSSLCKSRKNPIQHGKWKQQAYIGSRHVFSAVSLLTRSDAQTQSCPLRTHNSSNSFHPPRWTNSISVRLGFLGER